MTPEQLAEIEERAKAATEGPWYAVNYSDPSQPSSWSVECHMPDTLTVAIATNGYGEEGEPERNAWFIAHAKQDIPALLAHVQTLQAELDQLRTIFSRDLLEDDASIRAAYERGKMDAARELAEAVRSKPHAPLSALLQMSEDMERIFASLRDPSST